MRSCFSGETALSPLTQGKDVYELEVHDKAPCTYTHRYTPSRTKNSLLNLPTLQVLLRIKESEIQYLKQEIHSLKDELQSALRVSRSMFACTPSCLVMCSSCRWYCSFRTRNMPQINIRTSTLSSALWRRRQTATSANWRRNCSLPRKLWARGLWMDQSHLDTVTRVCSRIKDRLENAERC